MTESERRFEEYCALRGYRFETIVLPTNEGRRPDYRLHLPAGEIIVEVKQIEPGRWEKEIDERLETHGRADLSRAIGKRAREMIRDAAPQLRRHRADGVPCVIVAPADRYFIKGDHPEKTGHFWLEYIGPRNQDASL